MPIHLDRLCLCPYLTGSPLFGFVTPGTSCPSAGSAVPAPARAQNTAQRSEIRKPGLFYSAENQQKNLTLLPGGTFTDPAQVPCEAKPWSAAQQDLAQWLAEVRFPDAATQAGRHCQAANPMLVTYSHWPHGDPRSTIWSIQAWSKAWSSFAAQASTTRSQRRTLKVRHSTTRWCGRGTWDRLSGCSSTRVPHPSPQCELSSARPSTPLHTWSRTDQASRRTPSRDRRCCRAPRWRPRPLHAAPCHPCSCRRRRAPR